MDVSVDNLDAAILASGGPVLFLGAADTGKTTLVGRYAAAAALAGRPAAVLDTDVGQSEIGPPGMLDLALAEPNRPMSKWKPRGQWYVGATSPYGPGLQVVAGARRLADRAIEREYGPLLVDTSSFVNTPGGLALSTALVDVLRPALVVAVQIAGEMERWLRGCGIPVARLASEPAVRSKPSGLRAARRAARLNAYFHDAPEHRLRLTEWALRNTRLGAGEPLPPAERDRAAGLMGRTVVHAERAGGSVAFWTRGQPRHDPQRFAPEFGAQRAVALDASVWEGRSVGFLGPDGMCLAMGCVVEVDWSSLVATVRAPVYGVTDAVALSAGTMRHRPDGDGLPNVPDA